MASLSVLIAHPSPDLYGADLQLLESVQAMTSVGMKVTVVLPRSGPLVSEIERRGAETAIFDFPVLRKSTLNASGVMRLVWQSVSSRREVSALIKSQRPDVLYVNTITIPIWLVSAWIRKIPSVCHVHEAPVEVRRPVRDGLLFPLYFSNAIVVNSRASADVIKTTIPWLRSKIRLVYNGVARPPDVERSIRADSVSTKIVYVGRLSPRKGADVALRAVGTLREAGHNVSIELCGTVFEGYEWYERDLRASAETSALQGAVTFRGYVSPTWPALFSADIAVVPSLLEPFGNTAVEAQMAAVPVVASDVQGLAEIVQHGETGLLCVPGDSSSLAEQLAHLIIDPEFAKRLAIDGRERANREFSVDRYQYEIRKVVSGLAGKSDETALARMKFPRVKLRYLLRLPDAKRRIQTFLMNNLGALPGVPQSIRRRAIQYGGVKSGNARFGHSVRFLNTNIEFGKNVTVEPQVRFEGIGRIRVGDGVLIGRGAVITTTGGPNQVIPGELEHPDIQFDKILVIQGSTKIPNGITLSPYAKYNDCDDPKRVEYGPLE